MPPFSLRPRIRIVRDDGTIVMGPGKADLLEAIARAGSIRAAAAELGMSYMRAWTLIRTMNAAFRTPLVEKIRGGTDQGGARLTDLGKKVLDAYREMEADARKAIASHQKRFARFVR
ncbi:MAG TPA: LysR family transcriptional regulator [Thermoanaerobaculia bacterium]|nr:LysR family transcriptional regulator [Thermoanaerobaculia bacterium]